MPRRRRRKRRGPRRSSPRWFSARVTRTRGSGASRTTSYRAGGISITGVSPTGRVAGSRLTIRATVWAYGGSLSKRDVRLYFDGVEKTRFRYDSSSGNLSYYVGRALTPGSHEVMIEVGAESSDSQGRLSDTARKRWTFTVVRR